MATTYYSDHLTTDGINKTSVPVVTMLANPDKAKGRLRYKRMYASITGAAAVGDKVVLGTIKSSDRLIEARLGTEGVTATTLTADLGLFKSNAAHDASTAIDQDLGASAVNLKNVEDVDVLKEALLDGWDRGLPAWRQAVATGAQSYTADPKQEWDIVLTVSAATSATVFGKITLELFYVAGD